MKDLYKGYRADIDGLRFFAVFAVIINHINKELLPMGYLGVDIFFVISGFVISMSLLNSKKTIFKDFIFEFYNKRVKRILPALGIYVLLMGLITSLVVPMPGASLKTGIFSMFGLSNIHLYSQSIDYFASSSDLNTFTNTWSLSVEEQFYLIFPLIIWFFATKNQTDRNDKLILNIVLSILCLVSYVIFAYSYNLNTSFAYYLIPARFWEIGLGCISYLILSNKKTLFDNRKIAIFSFSGIVLTLLINVDNPVISTTLIVLFTSIFVIFSSSKNIIYTLLSNNFILYWGKRSYSLYLWHWGVISIFRWSIGVSLQTSPIIIVAFVIPALLSYKYLELPLRKSDWFTRSYINILSGISISLITALSLFCFRMLVRYVDKFPVLYRTDVVSRKSVAAFIGCMGDELPSKCLKRNSSNNHAFLLGDSHLMGLVPSIGQALKSENYSYSYWGGVEHIRNIFDTDCEKEDCYEDLDELKNILSSNNIKEGDLIIYTLSRNRFYNNSEKAKKEKINVDFFDGFSRKRFANTKKIIVLEAALKSLSDFAKNKGAKIIFIDSIPVTCTKSDWIRSVSKFKNIKCSVNSNISKDDREPMTNLLNKISLSDEVYYIDPHDEICPDKSCQIIYDKKPLYADNSPHIAWESRFILIDFFKREINKILVK